jgi:KTSC domain
MGGATPSGARERDMELIQVDSSTIRAVAYDAASEELLVVFDSGKT